MGSSENHEKSTFLYNEIPLFYWFCKKKPEIHFSLRSIPHFFFLKKIKSFRSKRIVLLFFFVLFLISFTSAFMKLIVQQIKKNKKFIKRKNRKDLYKNSFLLHVPVEQPCYDFIKITKQTFKTKTKNSFLFKKCSNIPDISNTKKIKKWFLSFWVHSIFLMWRAVCTLEKFRNFTVASSSTITHDSIFISSSCRRKSEKKNVFYLCFFFQKRTKLCAFYCNTGVSQYIRAMMTWRVPLLRFFSLKRITPKERISLLARNMSVNNTKSAKTV